MTDYKQPMNRRIETMRTIKVNILLILLFLQFVLPTTILAQSNWVVEEETSLEGSISGTVKKGRIFKTSSGSIYEVTGLTLQLVLELSPKAIVLRDGNLYKLIVEGFDEPLYCKQLRAPSVASKISPPAKSSTSVVVESYIEGNFEGWDGDTIFKLDNGQIWQQSSYAYTYHYAYHPKVIIYQTDGGYKMKVDGVDKTIYVIRLK